MFSVNLKLKSIHLQNGNVTKSDLKVANSQVKKLLSITVQEHEVAKRHLFMTTISHTIEFPMYENGNIECS